MGRGRKELLTEAMKKQLKSKNPNRRVPSLHYFFQRRPAIGENTEPQIPISEELLDRNEKMSPQDLMIRLINPAMPEEETHQEELRINRFGGKLQDFFDWSHTPEPVYERPLPTRELAEPNDDGMSQEQVREIS